MTSPNPGTTPALPCVEQPGFKVFDTDGDGVLSIAELRAADPDNAQLQQVAGALEDAGVPGLRYTGCGGGASEGDDATGEALAQMIARAAVARMDGQ